MRTRALCKNVGLRCEPFGKADHKGVTLYIPVIPGSGNKYIRAHGLQRWRDKNDIHWLIKKAMEHVRLMRQPGKRARLLYTLAKMGQVRDYENLVTSMKPVTDCLVQEGWLQDDNPKWLDYLPPAEIRPSGDIRPGLYIRIEYEGSDEETTGNSGHGDGPEQPGPDGRP